MKNRTITFVMLLSLAALSVSCAKEDSVYPVGTNPFEGRFAPAKHIAKVENEIREVGPMWGVDTTFLTDTWTWEEGLLKRVDKPESNTREEYFYNEQGCIERLVYMVNTTIRREFDFSYEHGLLSQISYDWGSSYRYQVHFHYRANESYPNEMVTIRPLEDFLINLYGCDTLVQSWTLGWDNGNLVRATADSMATYCTGFSLITYFYDNKSNPNMGHFTCDDIAHLGLLDNPACLSRNNLVCCVKYNDYHGTITPIETFYTYQYLPDGFPSEVYYEPSPLFGYGSELYCTQTLIYE